MAREDNPNSEMRKELKVIRKMFFGSLFGAGFSSLFFGLALSATGELGDLGILVNFAGVFLGFAFGGIIGGVAAIIGAVQSSYSSDGKGQ
ncbi:hypothetical protein KKH18_05345 [bacterium]|nr:hypothetical protein [bacterium]